MADLHELGLVMHGKRTLPEARSRVLQVMRGFPARWWVCGGWAVDMFIGRQTRPHADIEFTILHRDHALLFPQFAGWELRLAGAGNWARWQGEELGPDVHQLWARPDRGSEGQPEDFVRDAAYLEICLETSTRDEWIYRRDDRLRRRLLDIGREYGGVPVLAPDIALLYKAKNPRPHDTADFHAALPHLEPNDMVWLRNAIATAHPDNDWFG
jgi:hypothetical protein